MKKMLAFVLYISIILPAFSQSQNLDFFIQKAIENSPILFAQNNENSKINLNLKQIETLLTKPQVSANIDVLLAPIISTDNKQTSFMALSNGATDYYGYDLAYSDGGQYQAAISVNQPLFNKTRLSVNRMQIDIELQQNSNAIQLTEKELKFSVQYQYLLSFLAQNQILFSQENQRLIDKEISIMHTLVNNGIYQASDLQLLQIESQNYESNSLQFKSNYQSNLSDLLILCGLNKDSVNELENPNIQLSKLNPNSIFLSKYRLDSLSILSSLEISNLQYKPQLSAFADAGLKSVYIPDLRRFGFSFGLSFSYLIYDGKQHKIQEKMSKIELDNTKYEANNFIVQRDLRNKKIVNQILQIEKQLQLRTQQLESYANLIELYKIQIAQGKMSIINFVEILRKISDVKQEKLKLEIQKQMVINIFNYWNE